MYVKLSLFWSQESILDHLFGHLGVSAVHSAQQALLSLYSYKDTTGIVGRFSTTLFMFLSQNALYSNNLMKPLYYVYSKEFEFINKIAWVPL